MGLKQLENHILMPSVAIGQKPARQFSEASRDQMVQRNAQG